MPKTEKHALPLSARAWLAMREAGPRVPTKGVPHDR